MHLSSIAKIANIKFNTLTRVQKYMTTGKKNVYSLHLFKVQFTYCHLIRMFYTKRSVGRINSTHERFLSLIQQNYTSDFEHFLTMQMKNEKTVHRKCIEFLMIDIYKYLNGLYPDIMSDIFKLRENTYNLINFHIFKSQNPRTKKFGLNSFAYRASQLWKKVPEEIRNLTSLPILRRK